MKRSLITLVLVAAFVVALDYATKQWVMANLSYQQPVQIIGDYVRFTYTRNSGIAFGLGAGTRFPYYVFSIVAAIVILYMFLRVRVAGRARQLALSLIFGGAIGNLIDRVRWGEVVDFIEVGIPSWHWPVFNIADSAVSVGVVLFALTWRQHPHPAPESESSSSDARPEQAGTVGSGTE